MSNLDLLEPFDKFIPLQILGKVYEVPENNRLIRIFQYLEFITPYSQFCWNGECKNCAVRVKMGKHAPEEQILACQTYVEEGMMITQLSKEYAIR